MLTVSHVLAGAAIGAAVPDGPLDNGFAFGLGVASHYLLDTVPHWENWFGKEIHGLPSGTPLTKMPPISIASGAFDLVAALTLFLFVFIYRQEPLPVWESAVFWGAVGAFLPDLLDNVPFISQLVRRLKFMDWERRFHDWIHIPDEAKRRVPYLTGLITQLIVVSLSLYLLLG